MATERHAIAQTASSRCTPLRPCEMGAAAAPAAEATLKGFTLPRLQNPKARRRDEVVVLLREVLAVLVVVDTLPLVTLGDLLPHDFHRFFRDDPLPPSLFPGQGVSHRIVVAAAVGPQVRGHVRVGFQLDADGVGVVVGRAGHGGVASSVPLVQCGFACTVGASPAGWRRRFKRVTACAGARAAQQA